MKLHMVLDEKYIPQVNIDENDIVLLKENFSHTLNNVYLVNDIEFDTVDLFNKSQEVRALFENKLNKNIFKFTNNFFTNLYLPLMRVYNAIEFLLSKYSIDDIILYGGNKKVEFIPYYFAEGEAQRKFLYTSSMFMNTFIYKKFSKQKNITFQKSDSIFKIYTFMFTRRYLLLIFKFFYLFFYHYKLKNKTKKLEYKFSNDKKNIVFPVRNIAQITTIEPLFKYFNDSNEYCPVFLVYERVLTNKIIATNYLEKQKYNTIQIYHDNDIYKSIFKSFIKTILLVFKKPSLKIWQDFKIKDMIIEMYLMNFEKSIYEELLYKKIKQYQKDIDIVFSTEIKSPEAFIENGIAKRLKIKCFNSQAQSIMKIPLPRFNMNGIFLFENKIDYDFFNNFNYPDKEFMKFIGSFKYFSLLNNTDKLKHNKKETIIYFTQNHEHNNQRKIINIIIDSLQKNQKLYIKKHPRDTEDYSDIVKHEKVFLENRINLEEIFNDVDIVISRTTTLLLDAILHKKIVLSILLSSFDNSGKQVYINENYLKIFYKLDELKDFNNLIDRYSIEDKYRNIRNDLYSNSDFIKEFKNEIKD